ncbi:division/cell wall cluster transcriptional repressor MraZ [candidate division TA06 bacterium]|uniref:Transcriptional regulator MraZ n=1 Tax=candidate division TA06 bacterium TaxID=2250710 RepID=A0A523UUL6_UNCT6|nr:MAG: division/cell wall cluster transcriptional repressor MraZ [candidate division TA06 bacterium]
MNYQGTYYYSVDHKGRIAVPAKFRKVLLPEADSTYVVTKGFDKCLSLYSLDQWMNFADSLAKLPKTKRQSRNVVRWFMANAERVLVDSQGRIKIPQHLLEYAGVKKDAVIIGVYDRMEIWNRKDYEENAAAVEETIEEDLESLDF